MTTFATNRWLAGGALTLVLAVGLGTLRAQEAASPVTPPVVPAASPAPIAAPAPLRVAKPVVIPFDRQPYQVSVTLGVAADLGMSHAESTRLVEQVREIIRARMGLSWNAQIDLASLNDPSTHTALSDRTAEEWTAVLEKSPFDKKLALTLDRVGTKYRLSGIEWDKTSQKCTPVVTRETFDRRRLPVLASDLAFAVFRPLVTVIAVTENTVELKVRGGDMLPPDSSLVPFQVGDHLTSYIRHYDKKQQLRRIQEIPWSYLRVDLIDRGYVRATQITPFVSPLAASKRKAESFALKVTPYYSSTTVSVIPRGKPDAPMAGYRAELLNRTETKDDKVEDRLKLRTDRRGQVTLPYDPAHPQQTLFVYSGASPLAKVPVIPGHAATLRLDVPDDAPRMNVEAETELLQSELVDVVARRHVMMTRARAAAQKGDFDQVATFQKSIAELPTLEKFQQRIENLRLPGVQAARNKKDKAQEGRITKLCDKITKQAVQHLDPVVLKEFETEMTELKKTK